MYLRECILRSNGRLIRRRSWYRTMSINLTDGEDCCFVLTENKENRIPRWNPTKSDLLADDWEVVL